MDKSNEIAPPWIEYPGHPPGDIFWRQSGEIWFHDVWRPYYDSLSSEEQKNYLARWNAPSDWQKYYFNLDFQKWLESIDDE